MSVKGFREFGSPSSYINLRDHATALARVPIVEWLIYAALFHALRPTASSRLSTMQVAFQTLPSIVQFFWVLSCISSRLQHA